MIQTLYKQTKDTIIKYRFNFEDDIFHPKYPYPKLYNGDFR